MNAPETNSTLNTKFKSAVQDSEATSLARKEIIDALVHQLLHKHEETDVLRSIITDLMSGLPVQARGAIAKKFLIPEVAIAMLIDQEHRKDVRRHNAQMNIFIDNAVFAEKISNPCKVSPIKEIEEVYNVPRPLTLDNTAKELIEVHIAHNNWKGVEFVVDSMIPNNRIAATQYAEEYANKLTPAPAALSV